ncbi:MAG: hypothetical protein NZM04_00500, partial [Methylacidiphilales bacterium]|nr:hypothetical protein [Candidatus Methylacidiphilales bacterium]
SLHKYYRKNLVFFFTMGLPFCMGFVLPQMLLFGHVKTTSKPTLQQVSSTGAGVHLKFAQFRTD